jgi:hypothetical protein
VLLSITRILPLLLIALPVAAADDDPWQPVRDLIPGAELRIYKAHAKDPLQAKFDRAGDASLIVITKNRQLSIPKEEIQRIDCRRPGAGLFKNTRTERKVTPRGTESTRATTPGATTSVKTGLNLKSAYQTIYLKKGTAYKK